MKELWFTHYERRLNDYEAEGMDPKRASDLAAEQAMDDTREQLADMADYARMKAKEQAR